MSDEPGAGTVPPPATAPPEGTTPPATTPPEGSPPATQPGTTPPETTPTGTWQESLSPELRGSGRLDKFKTQEDAHKAHLELEKKLGKNTVVLPAADAPPEEVAAYRQAIGVPDKPGDYEMPTQGLPEGFTPTEQSKTMVQEAAHRMGLTKDQAAQMYRELIKSSAEAETGQGTKLAEVKAGYDTMMKAEWGPAYEQNLEIAGNAIRAFGGEELATLLQQVHLDKNPTLLRSMHKLGKLVSEHNLVGDGGAQGYTMSPHEIQRDIAKLREHPKYNTGDKEHKVIHQKILDLQEMLHASEKKP